MTPPALAAWHQIVRDQNLAALDALLADDVVFHSPIVHTPQCGKEITSLYLTAAGAVLFSEEFTYVKEAVAANCAFLEFTTQVDGIQINGVDIINWNQQDQITEFKVMIRPLKAINLIHQMMASMLETMKGSGPGA